MASTYAIIGQPVPARVDGTGKVTGVTRYADDLFLPRMLHGKLLRSPHPHARIVRLDTSKAAALPGVLAVITGADLPQPYSVMPVNQDEHALAIDKVRYVGEPVAAVEVFYAHHGRHPVLMWVRTGAKRDGAITALHFKTFVDGGGYSSYGVASVLYTGALQTVTYKIPHYRFEGLRVFTNKPPCGPKRGHGTPQPRFALEVHLDKIAEDLHLNPVKIRRPHLVTPFSMTVNHLRITSCGLGDCIDAVVQRAGFLDKAGRLPFGRGIGLACSSYLSGAGLPIYYNDMPHAGVTIQIDRSGGVCVFCGAIDIGQGSDSVLVFIVAEELGLDPQDVRLVAADTAFTPVDLGSYASRVRFMAGNAAITAARKLRAQLLTAGERLLPVHALYRDDGISYLGKRNDEILTHIPVPPTAEMIMDYVKVRRRGAFDFPILGVAVALRLDNTGSCTEARVVLGAVASSPLLASEAAAVLVGQRLTPEVIDTAAQVAFRPAKPLDNTDLTLAYRKKMVRVHVTRVLRQLVGLPVAPHR